jgi:DNA-binding Lrp family transcriptional regulator
MHSLDGLDQDIIRLLRTNARMSNATLASQIGLSPSACLRRINLLEHRGVIRGYTVLLSETSDTAGMAVIVNITLEKQSETFLGRFEAAVRKHAEIRECLLMGGDYDYQLRVDVQNIREFERVHNEVLSKLPGVQRIHSRFSIRNVLTA